MRTRSYCLGSVCFALFFFGIVCLPVRDVSAAEPEVYSLERMVQMALEKSPEMQEVQQDVLAAGYDVAQAKAGRWAQLDATGIVTGAGKADAPTVLVSPVPGPNGLLTGRIKEEETDGITFFGRLDFTLSQPLFTFGKISNRIDAAEYGLTAKKAEAEKRRGELIQKVKELYLGALIAEQGKDAASDATTFIRDMRRRVEQLISLKAKNVDENDLYRLQAYEASIKASSARAESGSKVALAALKRTVGIPPEQEIRLDMNELPRDMTVLGSQQEYIAKALENRPEFQQIKAGVQAQRSLAEAAKADLYPSIFAAGIGSFAWAPGREEFENPYIDDDFNHTTAGGFLGINWHFDFGIQKARLQKARAEYQKMLYTQQFAEQNIPIEVIKNYQDVLENRAAYMAYEQGAKAARRWMVAAMSNFDLGVGSVKDMFDALDQYGKNQGEFLRSLYDYNIALARLGHSIGEYQGQYRNGAGK